MALSKSDAAAVLAAGQQGGLSASQSQSAVNDANSVTDKSQVFIPANTNANPTSSKKVIGTGTSSALAPATTSSDPGSTPYATYNGQTIYKDAAGNLYSPNIGGGSTTYGGGLPSGAAVIGAEATAAPTATQPTTATTQQTDQTQQQTQQQAANPLVMPASGSVVDLLNQAGADSSYAARSALAAQYGIQGYSGTAAQNQELAKKYLDTYNQTKGTAVPQNAADARSAIQALQGDQNPATQNPVASFYDSYSSMDPVMKSVYDSINQINSYINDKTSIQDEISKLPEFKERNDVKADLLDVKRVMDGTEDDIRDEINNAGGFATESQVQALTGARNKVLLKKANALTDQFNVLNDYVNQITDLTKANREEVMNDLQTKLGLTTTLFNMQQTMQNAARENMSTLVGQIGYTGLAATLQNDPAQQSKAEQILGLPQGALSNPAFLQAASPQPKLTTQVVEVSGRKALVTYDQTGNPVNMVDLGSAATAGSGGLSPGQVNAFNSIVSKYNASPLIAASDRTAVLQGTIANIKKNPADAAQQLNLAYSYIQALDTYQSSVREGELGLVGSIDSKIGQLSNSVQQIQNGQVVRPEVALQIANAAQNIVDTINSAAKQKAASFASQANVVGLGSYWNQYVSGFNQNFNQPATVNAKGNLNNAQFVEKTLSSKGIAYQSVLNDTPMGQIPVLNNSTGQVGFIPENEFNPSSYTRI